jgi:hypothetical protein
MSIPMIAATLLADAQTPGKFEVASLLPLAVILLCLVFLVRRSYRYFGRGRYGRRGAKKAEEKRRLTADKPVEILRWEVEMHETARTLSAQLDSKMSALQALVQSAQQEADRLERLREQDEKAVV